MSNPDWLPDRLDYSSFEGDWGAFFDAAYEVFKNDLINTSPTYKGKKVILPKTYPDLGDGKHGAFWHVASTGNGRSEATKIPDIGRLEVLGWIKPMLEHCPHDQLMEWEVTKNNKKRRNDTRTVVWFKDQNFAVVLRELNYVYVLITAYTTERQHSQIKLQKEYEEYLQKQTPHS